MDHELRTTESGTLVALTQAKTPQDAATAFISYERPLGWTASTPQAGHGHSYRVANAVALAGGDASAVKPGSTIFNADPYVQKLFFSTVNSLRDQQAAAAEQLAADLIDRAGKRQQPYPSQVDDFVAAATSANRPDLLAKVKPALLAYDGAMNATNGGVVATEYGVWNTEGPSAAAAAAQARAAAAGGAGMIERHVLDNLAKTIQNSQDALVKDPLGEAGNLGWV